MTPSKSGPLMHIVHRINRREKNKKYDLSGAPNTGSSVVKKIEFLMFFLIFSII